MVEVILEEASKLGSKVLAPINKVGDEQGLRLVKGKVAIPDGFAGAYQYFIENGWLSLDQNPEYGGQGMPPYPQYGGFGDVERF